MAAAQTAAPAPGAPPSSQMDEVVVTGSRLNATSTFSTPTPVTAVSADELRAAAPSTLAAGLQTLPSIVTTGGPTAGGGTANGGQNFLNLRGLGASRTLILLDGHRYISAGPAGVIDVNLLPSGLVSRVDVVTGGASAAYGSDAVAGVINFILDKKYTGFKADVSVGESQHHDSKEVSAVVSYGRDYAGGRGHVILSGEYYDNQGVDGSAREFRRTAANLLANPSGLPRLVTGNDLRTPYTTGGLIVIGAGGTAANNAQFQGIQFGPGGTPMPYSYGTIASDVGVTNGSQNGGDGFHVSTGQEILRPLNRQTIFARTDFQLTDSVNLFAEASYGQTETVLQSSPTTGTLTIQRDNAYLAQAAPSIVARMTALGVTRLTMNRETLEAGVTNNDNMNFTARYLAGLNGDLGGWKWEASVQQGENRNKNFMDPNIILGNIALAVDAVTNPANGSIVCRSTLTAPTNGCVPFNPFGAGSPSAASLRYVMGHSVFVAVTKEKFAEANIAGDLFNLPAGPIAVAAGVEWRNQRATTVADPLSNAGAYRLVNAQDFAGEVTVKEGFVEAQFPILKDWVLVKSLDLNVAGRHTVYSTSGGVNTWKAGLSWQIVDDLRVRGTRSRDIRAPNINELFAAGRQTNITIDDTLFTGRSYFSVPNKAFGNAALEPEVASTTVLGVVYEPAWLPTFKIAVDAYAIRIKGAIGSVGGQAAVTQCNMSNQVSDLCAFVTRDPVTRAVIQVRTSPANLTVTKTDGVDIEVSYRPPLNDWLGERIHYDFGDLSVRLLLSDVKENVTISPLVSPTINNAGTGSQPHWRGTLTLNYVQGPWVMGLQGRYIGSTVWDKTRVLGVDTDFNHVASRGYLDGQIVYRPTGADGRREYYLNVQNIFDRDPAFDPQITGATPLPTNPDLYDQVGRMFRVGVRLKY